MKKGIVVSAFIGSLLTTSTVFASYALGDTITTMPYIINQDEQAFSFVEDNVVYRCNTKTKKVVEVDYAYSGAIKYGNAVGKTFYATPMNILPVSHWTHYGKTFYSFLDENKHIIRFRVNSSNIVEEISEFFGEL